jgi:hypothetical protein
MALTLTEHPSALTFAEVSALADPDALVPNRMYPVELGCTHAHIVFKGTYTGSPSAIHFRIKRAWDDGVVQCYDDAGDLQDWLELSSDTIGGGNWTGTAMRVPQGVCADGDATDGIAYIVEFSEDGGSTVACTSVCKFRVGILVFFGFQSNGERTAGSVNGTASFPAYHVDCWMFNHMTNSQYSTATAWGQFAANSSPMAGMLNYIQAEHGCPAAVLPWGQSATSLEYFLSEANGGPGGGDSMWDNGGITLVDGPTYFDAFGKKFNFAVWMQGENNSSNPRVAARPRYRENLHVFHWQIAEYGGRTVHELRDIPFLLCGLGALRDNPPSNTPGFPPGPGVFDTSDMQALTQEDMAGANRLYPEMHLIGTFSGEEMWDDIHIISQTGYNMARRFGRAITSLLGSTQGFCDPTLTHGKVIDGTTTRVFIRHGAGTDIDGVASSSNFTGFEVFDPGTGDWISGTANRQAANAIDVVTGISLPGTEARRVRYASTDGGPGSNAVKDNGTPYGMLMPTHPTGIAPQPTYEVVQPEFLCELPFTTADGYTGTDTADYPITWPTQRIDAFRNPLKTGTLVLHIFVLEADRGTNPSHYSTVTVTLETGREVVAEVIERESKVSYHRVEVNGLATEFTFSVTRVSADSLSTGLVVWASQKHREDGTPTFYYNEVTGTSNTLTMNVSAHASVVGLSTSAAEWYSDFSGDVGYILRSQGACIPFERFDATADATSDLIVASATGSKTYALAGLVIPSVYTAVAQTPQEHNGGRYQTLSSYYEPKDMVDMLIDRLKAGSGDIFQYSTNNAVDRTLLANDGWPITTGARYVARIDTQNQRPGDHILVWRGTGKLWLFGQSATISSFIGSPTIVSDQNAAGTNCAVQFSLSDLTKSSLNIDVEVTDPSDPPYDIRVVHVDDWDDHLAGKLWQAHKMAIYQDLAPGSYRFVQNGQDFWSGPTTMAQQMSPLYATWGGYDIGIAHHSGEATLVGATYEITVADFDPAVPRTIMFSVAATGGTHVDAGNGSYALKAFADADGSSGDPFRYTYTVSDSGVTACWDPILEYWIVGDPDARGRIGSRWPIRAMTDFCNELRTNIWYNLGDNNTAYPTEVVSGVANKIAHQTDPWLAPDWEEGNEPWQIARTVAFKSGWLWGWHSFTLYGPGTWAHGSAGYETAWSYGKRRVQVMCGRQIAAQFHNDRTRFRHLDNGLLDCWGFGWTLEQVKDWYRTLQAYSVAEGSYMAIDGLPAATNYLTHLTLSPYYNFAWCVTAYSQHRDWKIEMPSLDVSGWPQEWMEDVYAYAMAEDTGDTATIATLASKTSNGPTGTEMAQCLDLMTDKHCRAMVEVAAEFGLQTGAYEGGAANIQMLAYVAKTGISNIVRGATTTVTLEDNPAGYVAGRCPPVGQYVGFWNLNGATITIDTGGTGWEVMTSSDSAAVLMSADGTQFRCGAITNTPCPAAGTVVGITAVAGMAEANQYDDGTDAPHAYQVLDIDGLTITLDLDSSGFSAPVVPGGGATMGGIVFPQYAEVTAITQGVGTAGDPTIITLAAGTPMPRYPSVRLRGTWIKDHPDFGSGGKSYLQADFIDVYSAAWAHPAIDGTARTIELAIDTTMLSAYSGTGVWCTSGGVHMWGNRLTRVAKWEGEHDWFTTFFEDLVTVGIDKPSQSWLADAITDGFASGVMDRRTGFYGGQNTPYADALRAFNDPTPVAPTINSFTANPTSGTDPLDITLYANVSGYPPPTITYDKSLNGTDWTTIYTGTSPVQGASIGVGVWDLRASATNTEGSATPYVLTDHITVTEGGGGGGGPAGGIQKLGATFPRLGGKFWRLPV